MPFVVLLNTFLVARLPFLEYITWLIILVSFRGIHKNIIPPNTTDNTENILNVAYTLKYKPNIISNDTAPKMLNNLYFFLNASTISAYPTNTATYPRFAEDKDAPNPISVEKNNVLLQSNK